MKSVPVTIKVVSSNPAHGKVYSIRHVEYYLSNIQTINYALERTKAFSRTGRLVTFNLRECVHFFNVFVVFFTI